jgi:hypothetical protein
LSSHHDGCFGCGQANPFGLQLEDGRFFVKQDHQGAPGVAHRGIIAAALCEVIGGDAGRLEVEFHADVPVGVFVEIGATATGAEARVDGSLAARATVS